MRVRFSHLYLWQDVSYGVYSSCKHTSGAHATSVESLTSGSLSQVLLQNWAETSIVKVRDQNRHLRASKKKTTKFSYGEERTKQERGPCPTWHLAANARELDSCFENRKSLPRRRYDSGLRQSEWVLLVAPARQPSVVKTA